MLFRFIFLAFPDMSLGSLPREQCGETILTMRRLPKNPGKGEVGDSILQDT